MSPLANGSGRQEVPSEQSFEVPGVLQAPSPGYSRSSLRDAEARVSVFTLSGVAANSQGFNPGEAGPSRWFLQTQSGMIISCRDP